ncbi:MAG TPA: Nif3-like dinuclear metal center hexameric protein [Desulfobulbus sp.]|nr:Nif3-like dinuclear metal center hexameric protein [Desulfobulbus sp.]
MDLFVQDILDILEQIAPSSLAESWDNTGLLIGEPDAPVHSLLIALDPVLSLFHEAASCGANVIITHHPALFHPLHSLRTDQPIGSFIAGALQNTLHVIGCHTNLDSTIGGVSDVLARGMQLQDITPLVAEKTAANMGCGLGRIGNYVDPMSPQRCIELLRKACDPPWLLEAGPRPAQINRVAVCGGSCSEFAETAKKAGADLFITAEVKHSTARWAEEAGFWIIDGGHFATEHLIVNPFRQRLQQELVQRNVKTKVYAARQQPPLTLVG